MVMLDPTTKTRTTEKARIRQVGLRRSGPAARPGPPGGRPGPPPRATPIWRRSPRVLPCRHQATMYEWRAWQNVWRWRHNCVVVVAKNALEINIATCMEIICGACAKTCVLTPSCTGPPRGRPGPRRATPTRRRSSRVLHKCTPRMRKDGGSCFLLLPGFA